MPIERPVARILSAMVVLCMGVTVPFPRSEAAPAAAKNPPGRFHALPRLGLDRAAAPSNQAASSLPFPRISARVEYGEGGAVRFIVKDATSDDDRVAHLRLETRNEGRRELVVLPRDRYFAVNAHGKSTRLDTGTQKQRVLAPGESAWIDLEGGAAHEAIVDVRVESGSLDRQVDIRQPFEDARVREKVSASFSPDAVPEGASFLVSLAAIVGPDGHVENVVDLPSSREPAPQVLRESARTALRQWVFVPARDGSTAVRTVHGHNFMYGTGHIFRAVVPGNAREIESRIAAILQGKTGVVARIPEAGGFVVGQPMMADDKLRWARALLIRCGEEPGGAGVWITSTFSKPFRQVVGDVPCGCGHWSGEDPDAARKALLRLVERLEVAPSPILALAEGDPGSVPSGLPEPEGKSAWDLEAINHVLRWTISAAYDATPPAPEDLPSAESFLPRETDSEPGAPRAGEAPKPPRVLHQTPPIYPEIARRARITGRVILQAIIDEQGYVQDVEVLRGSPLLTDPAMQAVCCWRYEPATLNGRPIPVYFTVVVTFSLN